MYLTIIKNDLTIDHRELGIKCLSFDRDSVSPQNEYESVEGRHGLIPLSTTFGGRPLRASFYALDRDYLSYQLLKNEIYNLFSTENEMIIIDSRQPGKRWNVKVSSTFGIENINFRGGKFTVEFISASAFAESIGSTLDPLTFDAEKWQTGQGLILDELMYTQSVTTFQIYNAADGVIVDPRKAPLLITFKGASTNLQIKNLTTGDTWTYTGTTLAADEIKLDGIRSTKNGLTIFRNTNHKFITLAPGYNSFQLVGTTGSFTISFSFRFYTI
jgi:phage-related protein